ncbi:MAG: hypothetical protein ACHRXM_30155 [Isosphaerales bacterium]
MNLDLLAINDAEVFVEFGRRLRLVLAKRHFPLSCIRCCRTTAIFPSEETIRKLAKGLNADVDELLLMAEKIPDQIRRRVLERPEAFRLIAELDDKSLDRLMEAIKVR